MHACMFHPTEMLSVANLARVLSIRPSREPWLSLNAAVMVGADTRRCREQWRGRREVWQREFPWLSAAWSGPSRERWGVGCVACFAVGGSGSMASFRCARFPLMKALFTQHEHTAAHKAALEGIRYRGLSAPSSEHFIAVLDAVRQNRHRQPIDGVAGMHKIRKMRWCLAEAARTLDRRFLKTAASVTLFQDGRHGKLLVRFKGSNGQLVTRRGVLGVIEVHGDAYAIRDATVAVTKRSMTSMHGAPFLALSGKFHDDEYDHLVRIIEFFVSDAAGDEQKAGRILRDGFKHLEPALPSLKIVVRDRAHASRRIISRGWAADPFLKMVLDMLLNNKMSIIRVIENSIPWKSRFQENIANTDGPVVSHRARGLDFSAQRFDSTAKPLSRSVLFWQPLLNTAVTIMEDRGKQQSEAVAAKLFLKFVDEEVGLTVGMLADGGDETLLLTRTADNEMMDPCRFPAECVVFHDRLLAIWGENAACWETGFTKLMLQTLRSKVAFFLDGSAKSVGGPGSVTPAIMERCRQRFVTWITLVRETIQAEFPNFEFAHALDAFNLDGDFDRARLKAWHTHTHTHTYIYMPFEIPRRNSLEYIYIYIYIYIFGRNSLETKLQRVRSARQAVREECREIHKRNAARGCPQAPAAHC